MSYWISEIYREFDDRTTGVRNLFCHVFADDVASMPANDSDRVFTIGSVCDIIANGDKYMMNSSGTWVLQPSGQMWVNVYTKSEIDNLISDYQPLLTFDNQTVRDSTHSLTSGAIWSSIWTQMLGLNTFTNLAAGDDLNDFQTPGIYRCTSSTTAAQLINMPSPQAQQAGGRLIVFNVGGTGRYIQFYISSGARFWLRSNISSGWQSWYEYAGTQVV